MSASTMPQPQCQVILTLAHLLQQHSLYYDDEKDVLLNTSAKCASKAKQGNQNNQAGDDDDDIDGDGEEVHMILTGSPRPTFAETNAWLLEGQNNSQHQKMPVAPTTPRSSVRKSRSLSTNNDNDDDDEVMKDAGKEGVDATAAPAAAESFRGSYSIADNNVDVTMADNADDEDANEEEDKNGAALLQEYIQECTHNSSTRNANMDDLGGSPTRMGGSVLSLYRERKYSIGDASAGGNSEKNLDKNKSTDDEKENKDENEIDNSQHSKGGPMVGHAVVNAISQQQGVGLRSARAKLLQGTIDRPLWDQRRWTDGECLFSELVEKCGLESFENVGSHIVGSGGGGADAAAGAVAGLKLEKTTNLSANLITVPAPIPSDSSAGDIIPGLAEDTFEEIARGILRCLKRKKSPPASKVYVVLPPNGTRDAELKEVVGTRLVAAWSKLEQYNNMIGAPMLMAGAVLEFVDLAV